MNYPSEITDTYEVQEQIGEGGGGKVFLARHKRLQKLVVLKKVKGATGRVEKYRGEVDILKNLRHSYLPQVLDFLATSEGIFTVMDYIPGQSLQDMLKKGHRFTEKEVLKYAKQICEALAYLHSQNPPIVHEDIKPDNVMITPEGNVCLIDFNISGVLEGHGAQILGATPGFASPEQIRAAMEFQHRMQEAKQIQQAKAAAFRAAAGEETELLIEDSEKTILLGEESRKTVLLGEESQETVLLEEEPQEKVLPAASMEKQRQPEICIDKRSDIYSLGATLYVLLTGTVLTPSKKRLHIPNVSTGFLAVLNKAVALKPEQRYADAGKMLQALLMVHKKDKKYRRLILRQELALVFWVAVLAGSVLSVAQGIRTLEREKEERYELLVEQLQTGTQTGIASEAFDAVYEEAVSLYAEQLDAYYEKAYYLFTQGQYEFALVYMDEVLSKPLTGDEVYWGNLYYLYGDCWFRYGDYLKAEFNYEKALTYAMRNPALYRDYAIALVYQNKMEEAEEILHKAVNYGLGQADILLVQGEIERMLDNHDRALECFAGVLAETKDEYIRQRAYIMASKTFEALGTEDALTKDTEWLSRAARELSMSNRLLIYERLVQDYITLGELTGKDEHYREAVRTLQEIMNMGWDTYLTYSNAIILCMRTGNLEDAQSFADIMKQRYPERYVTYMRLCYLEVEKQNRKENSDRDYTAFAEYYQKAKDCYQKQVSGNVSNTEMQLLDSTYKQIEDGGWLH